MFVCLSICLSVREYVSGTTCPMLTRMFVRLSTAVTQPSSCVVAMRCLLIDNIAVRLSEWRLRRHAQVNATAASYRLRRVPGDGGHRA